MRDACARLGFVLSLLIAARASAIPFDLIVADEIQAPGALWGIGSVGIVVATTDPITREHLEAATIVSSPGATFHIFFITDRDVPTIMPGQYAGETSRLSEPPLTALLNGETPAPVVFDQGFAFTIEYEPQLIAGEALSSTFTLILGAEAVTFDVVTTVVDWSQGHSFTAQRLRSSPIPEPGTGLLVIAGLVGFGMRRRNRA